MITLYGIKNCDTVKKARQWLDTQAIAYRFHDFRNDGLTLTQLQHILSFCAWDVLLNKRSSTWKTLSATQQTTLNAQSGVDLLLEHPTLIKRPVLDTGDQILVGFNADEYQTVFASKKPNFNCWLQG